MEIMTKVNDYEAWFKKDKMNRNVRGLRYKANNMIGALGYTGPLSGFNVCLAPFISLTRLFYRLGSVV